MMRSHLKRVLSLVLVCVLLVGVLPGTALAADYTGYTVEEGDTITLSSDANGSNHSWTSSDTTVATVSGKGTTATVKGVSEGTVTITHTYSIQTQDHENHGSGSGSQQVSETYGVTVTAASSTVRVYVYVAAYDEQGNAFSDDMLKLLGIDKSTIDANGYFPAGEITLNRSFLTGKNYTTQGAALITSSDDWTDLITALGNLDTSGLIDMTGMTVDNSGYAIDYSVNKENNVGNYISMATQDVGQTWGSQKSALFRWNMTTSYGFADQTVQYHLDLRFQTAKITYYYGNNGIESGNEKDGNVAVNGTKVYIQGATLDLQPTITAPEGYKIAGYYTNASFTTEWEDITGSPIDEDIDVYVKLVPLEDVTINYVVKEGIGTVTDPSNYNAKVQNGSEYFNPKTGSPVGSTAEAGAGYEFEGWYSDAELTNKVSSDANYIPSTPTDGWKEKAEYTYYAKFVPTTTSVTVTKQWEDDESATRPTRVTVGLYNANDDEEAVKEATITAGEDNTWTYTFTDLPEYNYGDDGKATTKITYTVKETSEHENYTATVEQDEETGAFTITNIYTEPEPEYKITDFTKEVVTSTDDVTELSIDNSVVYPTKNADGTTTLTVTDKDADVTLLYKLTVTGTVGTSFTITEEPKVELAKAREGIELADDGVTITGTILETDTANSDGTRTVEIYVTRTFSSVFKDVTGTTVTEDDGSIYTTYTASLSNSATIKGTDDDTSVPEDNPKEETTVEYTTYPAYVYARIVDGDGSITDSDGNNLTSKFAQNGSNEKIYGFNYSVTVNSNGKWMTLGKVTNMMTDDPDEYEFDQKHEDFSSEYDYTKYWIEENSEGFEAHDDNLDFPYSYIDWISLHVDHGANGGADKEDVYEPSENDNKSWHLDGEITVYTLDVEYYLEGANEDGTDELLTSADGTMYVPSSVYVISGGDWSATKTSDKEKVKYWPIETTDAVTEVTTETGCNYKYPTTITVNDVNYVLDEEATLEKTYGEDYKEGMSLSGTMDDDVVVKLVYTEASRELSVEKELSEVTKADESEYAEGEKVEVGDVLTYTITVTNSGNNSVRNIVVSDEMLRSTSEDSSEFEAVTGGTLAYSKTDEATSPDVTENDDGTFTISKLDEGEAVYFTYTYKVTADDAGKSLKNTAVAESDDVPEDGTDETEEVEVENPGIDVTKTATIQKGTSDPVTVDTNTVAEVDDVLTYTITVKNTGDTTLKSVAITDTFTGAADIDSSKVSVVVTNESGEEVTQTPTPEVSVERNDTDGTQTISLTIASLDEGKTATITYTYTVQTEDANSKISNTATATVPGENGPSDEDTKEVPVEPIKTSGLTVEKELTKVNNKTYTGGKVEVGDSLTYTITVTNSGETTLYNIEVTDELPSGLTLVSSNITRIASLASGASETFTVVATVRSSAEGKSLTNTAVAKADDDIEGEDSETVKVYDDDYEYEDDTILSITKTVSGTGADEDGKFTILITIPSAKNSSYNYRVGNSGSYKTLKFDKNGEAELTIQAGTTVKIYGLESGWKYTVEELDADDYTVTYTNESGKLKTGTTKVTINNHLSATPDLNTEDHYSYIIGYTDGTVQPEGNLTRAEAATIFFRLLTDDARETYWSQTNPYTDVSIDDWYNNAISTLYNMGIISGYTDGTFQPDAPITRAELTKIAVSFFEYADGAFTYHGQYTDVDGSEWYADFVAAATELGLINGYTDGTFQPQSYITRAETCAIVNRTLGRNPDADHLLARSVMNTWPDNATTAWYYADIQEATNSHDYEWIVDDGETVEDWTAKLEDRDWAALEKSWSTAYSAPGGEVMG